MPEGRGARESSDKTAIKIPTCRIGASGPVGLGGWVELIVHREKRDQWGLIVYKQLQMNKVFLYEKMNTRQPVTLYGLLCFFLLIAIARICWRKS